MDGVSAATSPPPAMFGRYRVIEPLGSGSMGTVLLARDDLLGRDVALKVVRAPSLQGAASQMFRQRFLNEARAVAAVTHPNVVPIYDMGFEGPVPYLVMEYVRGTSLNPRHGDGVSGIAAVRRIALDVARGLAAAHAAGLLHRDIKPGNILVATDGAAKLADFGVARVPDSNITLMGQFLGTPMYGAPEALAEGTFTAASDVFSLGVTLYETLAGARPFGDKSTGLVLLKEPLPPLSGKRAGVPRAFGELIAAMLATKATDRPTVDQIIAGLERLAAPAAPPISAPPIARPVRAGSTRRWLWGAATATLLGLGLHVAMSYHTPTRTPAEHLKQAEEKVKRGDLKSARRELEQLLTTDPKNARAREWKKRLDRAIGDD